MKNDWPISNALQTLSKRGAHFRLLRLRAGFSTASVRVCHVLVEDLDWSTTYGSVRQIDGTNGREKTNQVLWMIKPGSFTRFVKARLSGGDDLFYKWTNFSFENVSFIAPGVPLTSTAITLLSLMIVLDKTRQLYLTRVAQSAAKLVSLGALGSIRLTYTHLQ